MVTLKQMDLTEEAYNRVQLMVADIVSARGITGYDVTRLTIVAAMEASDSLKDQYCPKVDWDRVRACLTQNANAL